MRGALRLALLGLAVLQASGCFTDRERPGPTEVVGGAALTVRIVAPPTGATVLTGVDIVVQVEARDLSELYLSGVGFAARRLGAGSPLVDSAAVHFPLRSDSTHAFTFRIPDTFPTNTQVDVVGIAFGPGGETRVSEPVHMVVVQCPEGECL